MRVKWSSEARRQLVAIFRYAARDNPSAARRLVERLRSRVTQLRQHPLSGRMVPEMGNPALRELVEAPYRIIYTITMKPRSVVIVAVHREIIVRVAADHLRRRAPDDVIVRDDDPPSDR